MSNDQNVEIYARFLRRKACMIEASFADALGLEHPSTVRMQEIVLELAGLVCDIGYAAELDEYNQAVIRREITEAAALDSDRYDLADLSTLLFAVHTVTPSSSELPFEKVFLAPEVNKAQAVRVSEKEDRPTTVACIDTSLLIGQGEQTDNQ